MSRPIANVAAILGAAMLCCWGGFLFTFDALWLAAGIVPLVVCAALSAPALSRKLDKPSAALPAPDPTALVADAAAARRHALEYGLPTDPWTQLEGFWTASGDTSDEWTRLNPGENITHRGEVVKVHDPFQGLTAVERAEVRRLASAYTGGPASDEPFDLDSFVKRTRRRETAAIQRRAQDLRFAARSRWLTSEECQEAQALREEYDRRTSPDTVETVTETAVDEAIAELEREVARGQRSPHDEVTIVNGAGRVLRSYPQPDPDPTVRCTWTLAGTTEDDHVIRALRNAGVNVAIETTDTKQAHLAGKQSAIDTAKRAYTDGWRQRRTRTGVGPPPDSTKPTPNTPKRSLRTSLERPDRMA